MKQVFKYPELCHKWAHQTQESGRESNNRMFFEGKTIFSYGRHFPIATIEGNDVFFTLRDYSSTTSGHKHEARMAVSHKNIIYCYDVPVPCLGETKPLKKQYLPGIHINNTDHWKGKIKDLVEQLGNKKNRDVSGRMNEITRNVAQLNAYHAYFNLKVKDRELKKLLKIVSAPDFLEQVRQATEKQKAAAAKKMEKASKAHDIVINLWRKFDTDGYKDLPDTIKHLANYYHTNKEAFTRLRYNKDKARIETSKGVEIPEAIAHKAYNELNGCMVQDCKGISIQVLNYEITETTKDYIKAGCHTIPKSDVTYISELLNW